MGILSSIKNTILPSAPQDPNQSAAGQAESSFAAGLGKQRSSFTGQSAPQVSEGVAPTSRPPTGAQITGTVSGQRPTSATGSTASSGGPNVSPGGSQTIYADPNGMNNQNFALGLDKSAAEGNAPSAAEQLYRKGTDEAMANQLALAATTQGDNPGMSQRAGLNGAAQANLDATAGAGALRAQEMATARGAYDNAAATARGQSTQEAEANQSANLQQQLENSQFYLGLTDEQQKALQTMMGGAEANAANQQKTSAGNQAFVGGLLSGGGKVAGSAVGG